MTHDTAATATADVTTPPQKRDVYVTGFGKFGDVLENPTAFLAQKLAEHQKVTETHVLNVSAACAAKHCVEALAGIYARAEERGHPCIFLHFGVSTAAHSLQLEQVSYNMADFRIPDEQGYIAKGKVIHEGEPDDITTKVPLEKMLTTLKDMHPNIVISTDPGRYICNYVYYRSLVWAQRQATTSHLKHLVLFVHVPKFETLNATIQLAFAFKIVDMVADL